MTSKIFRSTVLVAVAVLLCSLGVVMGVLYTHFSGLQVQQLKDELSLAVTGTQQHGQDFLRHIEVDRFRITWIDQDGTVLFDTHVDQSTMENHADRHEIRQALLTGSGSSVRTSSTLTEHTFYEARRLTDGTVLRISTSQESAWALMIDMFWPIVVVVFVAIALSAFLARNMAKKIVEPLNKLDLEQPLENNVYEELSPLLHRLHHQHQQIKQQIETLRRKAHEFQQITDHMQEGLVLLSNEGAVLSINPTAKQLFAAEDNCIGTNFLQLEPSETMRTALNEALNSGHSFARISRGNRQYQFDLSRIQSDGSIIGAVVLIFDITEQASAEQLRREFSANVSHELKTPLQGIIGSAELLESGMVRQEDAQRFVGHIRKEASRLVCLIEDIIRLSQLDEGVALPTETVDLLSLAAEIRSELADRAAEKEVSIQISGDGFSVLGVRRLLYEILYNLCDNAIKYNIPGGKIDIQLQDNRLTVRDTGIGIPAEHQSRVFERFYRVDKSHSKQSGGTGLGLSIVKHAAAYHKASLKLESEPGVGTAITLAF